MATTVRQPYSNLSRGLRFLFLPGFDLLGRVSGIIALIISLVHPAIEAWHDFRRTPATVATNIGSQLELLYDPVQRTLDFRFPVVLRNDGTRDDLLQGTSVNLVTLENGTVQPMPGEGIGLATEEEESVALPYPVRLGSHRLRFSAHLILDQTNIETVRAKGQRRLVLTLKTEGNRLYTLGYCFYMTETLISDLFDSDRLQQKKFLDTSCAERASTEVP